MGEEGYGHDAIPDRKQDQRAHYRVDKRYGINVNGMRGDMFDSLLYELLYDHPRSIN